MSPKLSWSQYCDILPIKNINERNYYINQVILNNLSVRDLRREIKNKSFDRLSYKDKTNVENNLKNCCHNKTIGDLIVKKNNRYVIEYTTSNDIYITTYLLL